MSDIRRLSLRSILSGVNITQPPPEKSGEVIEHPASGLDQMERRIRDIENEMVDVTAELNRLGLKYMTLRGDLIHAQKVMCERLKDSGIRAEAIRVPVAIAEEGDS